MLKLVPISSLILARGFFHSGAIGKNIDPCSSNLVTTIGIISCVFFGNNKPLYSFPRSPSYAANQTTKCRINTSIGGRFHGFHHFGTTKENLTIFSVWLTNLPERFSNIDFSMPRFDKVFNNKLTFLRD